MSIFDAALGWFLKRVKGVGAHRSQHPGVHLKMRPARVGEEAEIMRLRTEAAKWIHQKTGVNQWANAWPDEKTMLANIRGSIERRETWMAEDPKHPGGPILGTIAVDRKTAAGLWTEQEMKEPALYFHRLIVDRNRAAPGVGSQMIEWAKERAREENAQWLRADVWTDNHQLQEYYKNLGFSHVRTVVRDDYPSGALFQLRIT